MLMNVETLLVKTLNINDMVTDGDQFGPTLPSNGLNKYQKTASEDKKLVMFFPIVLTNICAVQIANNQPQQPDAI